MSSRPTIDLSVLSALAIRRPVAAIMGFLALMLLGFLTLRQLPVQLLPSFESPELYVVVQMPGASPDTIERDVLRRLEGEIATVRGIDELSSRAQEGFALITVKLRRGESLDLASLRVQQRLAAAKASLSDQVGLGVQRFDTDSFANFAMVLSLRGDLGLDALRTLADEEVVPALQGVPGVVQVGVQGGASLQVAVIVDPERARRMGASAMTVRQALVESARPVQSVGDVEESGRRLPVLVDGRIRRVGDVPDIPVTPEGARLRDVSQVQMGIASSVDQVRVDGQLAVQLEVRKDPEANLLRTCTGLLKAIDDFNAAQPPGGARLSVDLDASEIIRETLSTLLDRALTGAILALLVLMVFLRDMRSVLVVAAAIPATLLIAADFFGLAGMTLNVLSMLGLAVSIGLVLDNSIVVLESISARKERGDEPREAARRGVAQVHRAVVAGTAAMLVVFVPLFVIDTEYSPILRELALSVVLPLVASLVTAVALVPVLASRIDTRRRVAEGVRWPVPFGAPRPALARTVYSAVLRLALRHPAMTCSAMLLVVVATLVFVLPLVLVFADPPKPPQERIEIIAELPPGSTIDVSEAVAEQLEELARKAPQREELRTRITEEEVRVTIAFLEEEDRTGAVDVVHEREALRALVTGIRMPAGLGSEPLDVQVDPPPEEGTPEQQGGLLSTGSLETVRVKGPPGQDLVDLAGRVRDMLTQIDGVTDVRTDLGRARPTLEVRPDRERLAEMGLPPSAVLGLLWTTRREGEELPYPLRIDGEDVPLALHVVGSSDRSVEDVRRFPLGAPNGELVPLEQVASVRTASEPPLAHRHERQRTVTLTHSFTPQVLGTGERVDQVRLAVRRAIETLELAPGQAIELEQADEAGLDMLKQMLLLGLVLVFVVLAMTFESATLPFLVMLTIPLAAVGSIAALAITGTGLAPMVVLALVVLLGLVVNQGILFIDRSEDLVARGWRRVEAVHRAAHDRLRPILMTTAATSVGLLPLAVSDADANELWPPFAIALLGGLLTATTMSLVFIPAASLLFARLREMLKVMGPALTAAATAACAGLLAWAYVGAEIVAWLPAQILLTLPAWLLTMLVARALQALWRGEHPPDIVGTGPIEIAVRNARKIYGGDPRPLREIKRIDRWDAIASRHGLDERDRAPREELVRQIIWQVGALGLVGYVMAHAATTWGMFLLALPALLVLGASARTVAALARRPGLWPPRGLAARVAPLVIATGTWIALWWRRRPDDPLDIVVLVLAGILLGAWAGGHLWRAGGLLGLLRSRIAPTPKTALLGVTLSFDEGLHGLLGPNGAGKSTLMRLIVNLYRPSRGRVEVNSREVFEHAGSIQPSVGFLPQFFGVPPRMTARQYLEHQGLLSGLTDPAARRARVETVLAEVGLADRANEAMGGFSGGMRQRVGIARTLLNAPRIVVVDEPTVGLDPRERIRFRNLLADLARTRVVLLSTHVVEDIGSACHDVVVLDGGRVLFRGTPAELTERARGRSWTIEIDESELLTLQRVKRIVSTQRQPSGRVLARGVGEPPDGAALVDPSLEDAYLLLLGRQAREVGDVA